MVIINASTPRDFPRIFMLKDFYERTFLSGYEYLLWKYSRDAVASNDDYVGDEGKENLIAKPL